MKPRLSRRRWKARWNRGGSTRRLCWPAQPATCSLSWRGRQPSAASSMPCWCSDAAHANWRPPAEASQCCTQRPGRGTRLRAQRRRATACCGSCARSYADDLAFVALCAGTGRNARNQFSFRKCASHESVAFQGFESLSFFFGPTSGPQVVPLVVPLDVAPNPLVTDH